MFQANYEKMKSAIQNISVTNLLADQWLNEANKPYHAFNLLNDSLQKTVQLIGKLDIELLDFNTDLKLFRSLTSLKANFFSGTGEENFLLNHSEDYRENLQNSKRERAYDNVNDLLETPDGTYNLVNDTKTIVQAYDEVILKVKKLETALDVIGKTTEALKGMGKLFFAAEGGTTAVGVIAAESEVIAGMAEAGGTFGPAGLIAGLEVLAPGSIVATPPVSKNVVVEIKEVADSPDIKKYFWNKERQADGEKLIVPHNVTNIKQPEHLEKELDGDYMVEDRLKRVDQLLANTQVDFSNLRNKWIKPEPFDLNEILGRIGVGYSPSKTHLTDSEKKAIEVKNIRDRVQFDSLGGSIDTAKINHNIAEVYRKYKPAYPMLYSAKVFGRLQTDEELDPGWRNKLGLPSPPANKKQNRKFIQEHLPTPVANANGRVITINLNKPLIENFTVNTKDGREGINDFKQKIEETLLEILNSANVIH
jgi:hypothetical protein